MLEKLLDAWKSYKQNEQKPVNRKKQVSKKKKKQPKKVVAKSEKKEQGKKQESNNNEHHELIRDRGYCYVCSKKIKEGAGYVYIGNGYYRHNRCFPGSSLWMKHMLNHPQASAEINEIFMNAKKGEKHGRDYI